MRRSWKARLDAALHKGELLGLYLTAVLLIAVEFGFVYWLHRINLPDPATRAEAGFITMPPWYEKPRFEVTMLLTVLAGMVFHACRAVFDIWRRRKDAPARQRATELVKQRLTMATTFAVLTGLDLALCSFLRG
jgi:succinate dehydrogenase hydrophobic anchor subunit